MNRALAGVRVAEAPTVWPWQTGPLYTVEPVGRDSQVTAVVIIQAPTDRMRADTWWEWSLTSLLLGIPLLGLVLGMWPMTRWIMRPVAELDRAAARISAGDLDARADADRGPPELRELAGGFNTMVSTVQSNLERQRTFVADAAHQLRNPMSGLQLSLDALDDSVTDPEGREAYADAVAEAERMAGMFEAMLAATALTSAGPVADGDARPPARIVAEGRERWTATLAAAGMELITGPIEESVLVREPTGGLASVLDELISNAARLSSGSRVEITMAESGGSGADVDHDHQWVEITVADDGIGLPEGDRALATGRFWRADRQQNIPGTGLGLSILNEVITDAGGSLRLAERTGGGLSVVIRLPRLPGPQ